jgi:hypothetical protein
LLILTGSTLHVSLGASLNPISKIRNHKNTDTALDVSNPGSYEDFVELLVPVLQERGIMQKEYAVPGGTFRENLRRQPGQKLLPLNHHAAKYRYDELKKTYADEDGDIVINRTSKQ